MAKLTWDQTGERLYETGVRKGVLFVYDSEAGNYKTGVAWNGLVAVNENPSGGEANALYADDIKYLNIISAEDYGATIEAYTYPDEFAECDGSAFLDGSYGISIGQQKRKMFAFCYRTAVGNDVEDTDYGYKLHIIYGAYAQPTGREYGTINDSPEAITFSWEITTTPVEVGNDYKPTAKITIDSTKVDSDILASIEESLYGTDDAESTLLLPADIVSLINNTGAQG